MAVTPDTWPMYAMADILQTNLTVEGKKFYCDLNQPVTFCFCKTRLTGKVRSVEVHASSASAVVHLKKDLYLLLMVEMNKTWGILFDGNKARLSAEGALTSLATVLDRATRHRVATIRYSQSNKKWSFA